MLDKVIMPKASPTTISIMFYEMVKQFNSDLNALSFAACNIPALLFIEKHIVDQHYCYFGLGGASKIYYEGGIYLSSMNAERTHRTM